MGRLTTHVLDTARGVPAAGLAITLWRFNGEARDRLATFTTNADGRVDTPLLEGAACQAGTYELEFDAGAYLRAGGGAGGETPFLGTIPVRFIMSGEGHYHVPLLLSPYGYSTYRGS